jgi:AraC family transcriptional regulator
MGKYSKATKRRFTTVHPVAYCFIIGRNRITISPKGYTRGFHIEFQPEWFLKLDLDISNLQGSVNLHHPQLKALMYNVFISSKQDTVEGSLAIDTLLVELFTKAAKKENDITGKIPMWVSKIREILHDDPAQSWTLYELSKALDIHPVHLSRDFQKYFGCNIGVYIRAIRLQKSLSMMIGRGNSLTDIALHCGFADQSHFIRSFKSLYQITPQAYRKLTL